MDRVNGADWFDIGGGKRGFRSQNAGLGIPGSEVTDVWLNGVQEELLFLVENAGLAASAGDARQVAAAIRTGKLNYIVAAGTGDAIILSLTPALAGYTAGLVLRVGISAANTGAVTVNVNGLGAKSLTTTDGTALSAGDLLPGDVATIVYNGVSWRVAGLARSEVPVIVKRIPVVHWRASQSTTSIPHNANTLVTGFSNIVSSLGDTTYSNGVWTIGAQDAGRWLVWGLIQGFSNTRVGEAIMINGIASSTADNSDAVNSYIASQNLNIVQCVAGTTVQLRLFQTNSGGLAQTIEGAMMAIRIGT